MARETPKRIDELTLDDARIALGAIQSALWATECRWNPDKEWSADTLEDIAHAMRVVGLGPAVQP